MVRIPEAKAQMERIAQARSQALELVKQVDGLRAQGDQEAVSAFVAQKLTPTIQAYVAEIDKFVELQEKRRDEITTNAQQQRQQAITFGLVAALLVIAVALALAAAPKLLLLDEPMAGMGPDESLQMVELIDTLRRDMAVLLIEHDMDAVFRLADRISVLVYGRVLTSGTPDAIRNNAEVQAVYLGTETLETPE
jgi:branched-chain amino acid transport system ATP-binding protein